MPQGNELIGKTLLDYEIVGRLGSGATGVVYKATHPALPVPVALKVLHDNLGSISGLEQRFRREARALKLVNHPNIVEIIELAVSDGYTFIAMELLEGETLEDALVRGPIAPEQTLEYFRPILQALASAHKREVVHRDLKPANVFLTKANLVKLLDFGLAKLLSTEELQEEGTVTRKGRIVGTPAYMAPEQITGIFIDVRADVYALGVMLFELLADRRPYLYERRSELLRAHLLEPIPDIEKARPGLRIHPQLKALIVKALAKDPADRYPNARAMHEALLKIPKRPAYLEDSSNRTSARKEAWSAVISESERRAITESAALDTSSESARWIREHRASNPSGIQSGQSSLSSNTPTKHSNSSSATSLFLIALMILALATALWFGVVAQ